MAHADRVGDENSSTFQMLTVTVAVPDANPSSVALHNMDVYVMCLSDSIFDAKSTHLKVGSVLFH